MDEFRICYGGKHRAEHVFFLLVKFLIGMSWIGTTERRMTRTDRLRLLCEEQPSKNQHGMRLVYIPNDVFFHAQIHSVNT